MRGGWSIEEDRKLTRLLHSPTPPSWQDISELHFASSRTPSQCRHRWHDTLKLRESATGRKRSGKAIKSRETVKNGFEQAAGPAVRSSASEGALSTRTRSNSISQESSSAAFTSTENALILQLLKEGHSPGDIERRWGEFSRRIAGSTSAGGAAGRVARTRKAKGELEDRASRIEQENKSTLRRHPRTFFPSPIVLHDLFYQHPISEIPSLPRPLSTDPPHPSSDSSLSSFSLSPPRTRPPRSPTTTIPATQTPPRLLRTPCSSARLASSPSSAADESTEQEDMPRQKQFTALELLAQIAESPKKGRAVKCLLSGEEDEEDGEGKENGGAGEVRRGSLFVSPKKRKVVEVEQAAKKAGKRAKT
ncbi:hypothetical protein BCR35DRAFT_354079 [Leucosporidium creatinivorum]|uniref:Uncharacterized protein n=1 Tax=Leucosporidium creatinivorum TaxID=106004 RepID=A0A1Y2ER34_9BASI|nr:hypothetical protein BCR35DRAFT_354079 [Leucosporidium creatinivorum]